MAKAFLNKGAKAYIGWNGLVLASHTDQTTTSFLQRLIVERQTIEKALEETFLEIGPDPAYKSLLIYYPLEAGDSTFPNIIDNTVTNTPEIILTQDFPKKRKTMRAHRRHSRRHPCPPTCPETGANQA